MRTPFTVVAALATLVSLLFIGCQSGPLPELSDDDTPEIPTDLLYGRDSLVLLPVSASPEVDISAGNLERFEEVIRLTLSDLVVRHAIPPVFSEDDSFRGDPAGVKVNVFDVQRRTRPRFGSFGPEITTIELSVEMRFSDHETGEPLGDWVDLAAIHGPATGGSLRDAMTTASQHIAFHIRRDLQGR